MPAISTAFQFSHSFAKYRTFLLVSSPHARFNICFLQMLSRALLSATAIIGLTATLVNAEQRYNPTDVTPKCQTLYVSQKATNGQVCLSINNDNLIIKYLAVTGYSYSEVHVWIGVSVPPTTAPGQFPFTSGNGNCTVTNDKKSATCTIPLSKLDGDLCDEELSITTHAALDGQTGWAGNKCINDNCHPWAKYFTFNFICSFAMTTSSSATLSTGGGPASTKTTSIISSEGISLTSLTELPPIITTTETITTTTITCPVSRRCYLVTCFSTRTAVLTRTVTVPCETSIVSYGTICC